MTASDRFVVGALTPAYMAGDVRGSLPGRVKAAVESLVACRACPRGCGVDRLADDDGVCHVGRYARVSSAFAHHGEEDCLRGTRGSGTVFFARCNLRCVFCQNWDISQGDGGRECRPKELAGLMLDLQDRGCHNINLVTPEHVVPQVVEALAEAIERGLRLPVVYNTSAYDSLESLHQLEGLIDVYMPDFKLWSPQWCARLLGARDYGDCARAAIAEMHRQVGDLRFTPDGLACRGLLVRHLVMPGLLDETASIMKWLAELSRDTYINIMGQYRPEYMVGQPSTTSSGPNLRYAEINRRPAIDELAAAYRLASQAGLWRIDGLAG
jgi:putative pyruvate formate lyase activating enzyme